MSEKREFATSLTMDLELRRKIDDLRLRRARETNGVPPPMRTIIVAAVKEYLERELRAGR
ncbi:hypothetical protein [Anaeromyxobacter sp. SG26]|uniref:hypothetical protein n=1 Tax=Anaeromyxobacter sp. SG26 TaxID=2925407 RepID=UPI001F5678DE|nr:hypothetical protein [Anaeromyxobacter sp. SG26]